MRAFRSGRQLMRINSKRISSTSRLRKKKARSCCAVAIDCLAVSMTRATLLSLQFLLVSLRKMRIAQEEVFGPVLGLLVAEDFEEAMEIANGVRFGLSASIVSRDLTRVHQFIDRIEAGLITVNLPTAGVEYQLPFGGTKESSYGMREQGPQAIDFYSETRTVYLRYAQ